MKTRNRRATLIALTALLAMSRPGFAADAAVAPTAPLTLDEAIRLTREHNPRALRANDEVKAAEAKVTQSRSGYFPQISAKAGYTYIDPVSELQGMQFMPNNNYTAKLTAEMMLFDFGRTGRRVDLARSGMAAAGLSRDLTVRDLSLATIRAFYSILFLQEAVKVQDKEIAALGSNLENMEKRYREGAATRFDLLTTEVRLSAAKNRKIDLQSQLENQGTTFRRLCGLKASAPLSLKGSFDTDAADTNAERLTATALEKRPEVALSRENARAAEARKSLAAKEWFPTISGAASWGTANGYVPNINEQRTNVMAGIQVQVPLFTGFRTSAATSEATAMMHAAELERIDTEEVAQAEVKQALNSLHTSREKIGTSALQVSKADLAARQARIRHQNGMGTTLDLLDAESALAQAELANLQARYEYVLNAYDVRRASGDPIGNQWIPAP
ncbi:MAG: TolC family protein [Chlorobiaceae bacterium]|nr:TolC family protein [Chlorobiaceae bacterium]